MRISVDLDDIGYSPYAYIVKPYLDGEFVTKCITADEEKGEITRYRTDKNNNVIFNATRNDLLRETLYGKVELKIDASSYSPSAEG